MSGQTILITGGAGFVGSNLAVGLKGLDASTRIIALDNLKRRGSELNINRLRDCGVEFIHGDIRNPDDIENEVVFLALTEIKDRLDEMDARLERMENAFTVQESHLNDCASPRRPKS